MNESFAERLYEAGFTDLVSVIPPGAQLMPSSSIPQAAVGKIPGRRHASGLWAGYNWRVHEPTLDDVRKWVFDGANIGLRATRFPGVDIDCTEPQLAQMIEEAIVGQLGPAPVRIGRAPKRLLMYRAAEPFSKLKLTITRGDQQHLVEILGEGQQYLVSGTHPSGAAYSWNVDPTGVELVTVTREQAVAALDYVAQLIEVTGMGTVRKLGDGRKLGTTPAADQRALLAPSVEALRECVSYIPNNDDAFPTRDDYIRMGYAIKAAAGAEHEEDGFETFAGWAAKHEADGRVTGNPETWRSDWRRLNPPFSVGWSFLAELARPYGYNDVGLQFDVTQDPPVQQAIDDAAPRYSDQWLAEQIVSRYRGQLRYVPQKGTWVVWDGARWVVDAELQGEDLILRGLKEIAVQLLREGVSDEQRAKNYKLALSFTSAGKATAVAQIVRANRSVAIPLDALDHDPWVLNTPSGIIDLKTGTARPATPDALVTKMTTVPPDFNGSAVEWKRFLWEATGGDKELEGFLQRYVGYCLTGSTREQQLMFVFGPGGSGKGTFLNNVAGIMGDYAAAATMDTFTVTKGDKHTTDLAMLVGARLVTASETAAGKRWDEQRVKLLTGGDPVTARFMRQDNFTYMPQFKLLFIGNHQPEIRDVDDAMKRRLHVVPFTVKPAVVDKELPAKLREEWPAILAWMIEGCLAWQKVGLNPPARVAQATEEYFENEDIYGAWIKECIDYDDSAPGLTTAELFQSWQEWANPRYEWVGSTKRLAAALKARGWKKWRHPGSRRNGFAGIRLVERKDAWTEA